jgi:starch phosphorylase
VLSLIESGFFSLGEPDRYRDLGAGLRRSDPYLVCADFDAYLAAEERAADAFRDPLDWSRRALRNVAGASRFSADDTIRAYASEIWGLSPTPVDADLIATEG